MNEQTTFTPGPWRVQFHPRGQSANGAVIHGADGTRVVVLPRLADRAYTRKVADAHLIAAAPDLYAASQKAEESIRRLALRLNNEPGNQTAVALWLHLADELRAAQAKAEGASLPAAGDRQP